MIDSTQASQASAFIASLPDDTVYPWIRRSMFSEMETQSPYYYEEPILSFGASYKNLDDSMAKFFVKWEAILLQLDFLTAKLHVETEYLGDYHFCWLSQKVRSKELSDMQMVRESNWDLGFGLRNMWGMPEGSSEKPHLPPDFEYPLRLEPECWEQLAKAEARGIWPTKERIGLAALLGDNKNWQSPAAWLNLTVLQAVGTLRYGFAQQGGHWVERLQPMPAFRVRALDVLEEHLIRKDS